MMATTPKPARRYAQAERLRATEAVLQQTSIGWPLDTIRRKVAEATGETSSVRTVQRDLNFLEQIGLAIHAGHGRWRAAQTSAGPALSRKVGDQ